MRLLHNLLARRGRERGAALPMLALTMVAVTGMVAFAADIGRLAVTRRHLQNSADAAALAGARQLPGSPSRAQADAYNWAARNGLAWSEVSGAVVSTTQFADDTLTINVRRRVPYTFARVFGLGTKDVTATARVQLFIVQGADTEGSTLFPYAVWGGNQGGPEDVKPGKTVTYRSNQWADRNVNKILPRCKDQGAGKYDNCNWNINSNNFKGYFHWKSRYVYIQPNTVQVHNQGGNAIGTEPIDELQYAQSHDIPVWLPIVTYSDDFGSDLHLVIVNFACVDLDEFDTTGGSDWTGTVLDPDVDPRCKKSFGLRTGGQDPPGTLMPQYTYVVTQ